MAPSRSRSTAERGETVDEARGTPTFAVPAGYWQHYGIAVQRKADGPSPSEGATETAARGVGGSGGALPHLDAIQRSFGRHDVRGIDAHVGGEAAAAARSLGARAYATGSAVAFREAPDVHTAAHEAAHVVQQRSGVHLKAGLGDAHDQHERHADAVADRVARGESAEALLDRYGGGGGSRGAVQRVVEYSEGFKDNAALKQADAIFQAVMFLVKNAFFASVSQAKDTALHLHHYQGGADADYAKTGLLLRPGGGELKTIEKMSPEEWKLVDANTVAVIAIAINTDKLGQPSPFEDGRSVGVPTALNTLIHEFTLHAEKYDGFLQLLRSGKKGEELAQLAAPMAQPGGFHHEDTHHEELVRGQAPSHAQATHKAIELLELSNSPQTANVEEYKFDVMLDRDTQAFLMVERYLMQHQNAAVAQVEKDVVHTSLTLPAAMMAVQQYRQTVQWAFDVLTPMKARYASYPSKEKMAAKVDDRLSKHSLVLQVIEKALLEHVQKVQGVQQQQQQQPTMQLPQQQLPQQQLPQQQLPPPQLPPQQQGFYK